MTADPGRFDHPLIVLAATIAAAAIMLGVTLWMDPSGGSAGGGTLPMLWVFLCGGLLFAVYAPAAARWSRSVPPHDCLLLGVFGVAFTGWGLLAAMCMGGFFGVAHAAVCTTALGALVRDWRMVIAPLPALAPAWAVTFRVGAGPNGLPMTETVWMFLPVLIWNLEMAVVFGVWSAWRRRHPAPDPRLVCLACGYDLAGLPGGICPECGAEVALRGARLRGRATPRADDLSDAHAAHPEGKNTKRQGSSVESLQ